MRAALLILTCVAGLQSGSDVRLSGTALRRFLKTTGASHLHKAVRWDVAGRTLAKKPLRRAGGYALFVKKGIGILVRLSDPGLREVLRKGGNACLRGRVRQVSARRRRKGDPRYYLDVREVSRRKK